jgi:hypothetical protein
MTTTVDTLFPPFSPELYKLMFQTGCTWRCKKPGEAATQICIMLTVSLVSHSTLPCEAAPSQLSKMFAAVAARMSLAESTCTQLRARSAPRQAERVHKDSWVVNVQ